MDVEVTRETLLQQNRELRIMLDQIVDVLARSQGSQEAVLFCILMILESKEHPSPREVGLVKIIEQLLELNNSPARKLLDLARRERKERAA